MDMIKVGRFISTKRKEQNLTQMQLAEKLSITDRAVSKWECGKAMPDSAIMLELCEILKISVNELLLGERIKMTEIDKKTEETLIELAMQKQNADKRLLTLEIVIGLISSIFLCALIAIGIVFVYMDESKKWIFFLLVGLGLVQFIICMAFALKVEQVAGYYECKHCHHRYVPTYKQVNMAMHIGRTRYMKCPHCGKKSWQKKVLTEKEEN